MDVPEAENAARLAFERASAPGAHALNCFITIAPETLPGLDLAQSKDGQRALGPIVVKDNIHVAGLPSTAGSAALRRFVPADDAPAVARLRRAGAVVIGKTSLHELAIGVTSANAAFGYLSLYEIGYSVEELIAFVDDELAREMLRTSQQLRDQPNRAKLNDELAHQMTGLTAAYRQLFADHDLAALLMPTVPVSPPRIDDVLRDARSLDRQRDRFTLLTATTKLATMVGAPSLSLPVGAPTGCGLLLDGPPQGDTALLDLAEHLAGALAGVLKN
jgi:Asp-tRNA(Asn)/Glu-tRNA(Gln) amidotransferase A subunit family amidase